MGAKVLLVGSGGREHALAWKLRQSPDVDEIIVAPGNAGTAAISRNMPIQPKDIDGLVELARREHIDFYLASMDDPQPLGLVDRLRELGILCYGPTAAAARIEASKAWAKDFMTRHGIPTVPYRVFQRYDEAKAYLESRGDRPVVVKASGLAAGKGAIVCNGLRDALEALDIMMVRRDFGAAGDTVVIEERLQGWETSAHAFCDGRVARLMPFATDYKRAQDGDKGLNTGGMGAYSPSLRVDDALARTIQEQVVDRAIAGLAAEGAPFVGTLFPGLMVTEQGPFVLEFNARWGDPETQVIIPRLESDLFAICRLAAEGRLAEADIRWSPRAAVGVVIASGGYPATYKIGYIVQGLDRVDPDVLVFHAGTAIDRRGIVTNGGRVLTIVALGETLAEARRRAYENVSRISFSDAYYRKDIAAEAVETPLPEGRR
ncbi:MAG: phosphoribosylamine--glycine ligase [Chloroflexota bacterium]|nr:phosphoribosylamine--glycine ligase [Dehalococcoidia bacterium]MDW8047373.1 phosphoribosylamine--glycine ligase [Chloroflexota bacterium]